MHSLLGLYCTKNRKRVLSAIASVEEDWVYNSPFIYFNFVLQGSSVLALIFMYFNY